MNEVNKNATMTSAIKIDWGKTSCKFKKYLSIQPSPDNVIKRKMVQ